MQRALLFLQSYLQQEITARNITESRHLKSGIVLCATTLYQNQMNRLKNTSKPSSRLKMQRYCLDLASLKDPVTIGTKEVLLYGNLQDLLQTLFLERLPSGQKGLFCKEAILRAGNVEWTGPGKANIERWLKSHPYAFEFGRMNCWEGVLYAAFQAGLVSKEEVLRIYPEPPLEPHEAYFDYLTKRAEALTTPSMGDLVIWPHPRGGIYHIGIYMGVVANKHWFWQNGSVSNLIAYIPTANRGHFSFLTIEACAETMQGKTTYYRCPW